MKFTKVKKIGIIAEKYVKENAPTLLMWLGMTCFAGALYETGKATVKSTKDVLDCDEELTKREIVKREVKNYIPAAILTAGGATSIIVANHINLARIETLAAAYALNKDKFDEYQKKVKEILGEQKEYDIRDKIAQDHITADGDNPPWMTPELLENVDDSKIEVRDSITGKHFLASKIEVDQWVNEFNRYLLLDGTSTLNQFYDIAGLENCRIGDAVVWKAENSLMDVDCHYATGTNGKPIMEIEFKGFEETPFRKEW